MDRAALPGRGDVVRPACRAPCSDDQHRQPGASPRGDQAAGTGRATAWAMTRGQASSLAGRACVASPGCPAVRLRGCRGQCRQQPCRQDRASATPRCLRAIPRLCDDARAAQKLVTLPVVEALPPLAERLARRRRLRVRLYRSRCGSGNTYTPCRRSWWR